MNDIIKADIRALRSMIDCHGIEYVLMHLRMIMEEKRCTIDFFLTNSVDFCVCIVPKLPLGFINMKRSEVKCVNCGKPFKHGGKYVHRKN
jgi:hypothetical protein